MATIEIRESPFHFESPAKTVEARWGIHDMVYYIDDDGNIAHMKVQEVHFVVKPFRDEQGYKIFGAHGEVMIGMVEMCKLSVYNDTSSNPDCIMMPACKLFATPEEAYAAYVKEKIKDYHKQNGKK